jgi:hypothetical protein
MFSAGETFSAAPLIATYNKIALDDRIVEHLASPGVTIVYDEFNAMQGESFFRADNERRTYRGMGVRYPADRWCLRSPACPSGCALRQILGTCATAVEYIIIYL